MLTFDNPYLEAIGTPQDLARVRPFLKDSFDPIVLERPGFLEEVGLKPSDGLVLKAGAVGQEWLRTPLFFRALAEEVRSHVGKAQLESWLRDFPELSKEQQWIVVERIYSRLEQLAGLRPGVKADKASGELEMSRKDLDLERSRWKEEAPSLMQELAGAILLQLLEVGVDHKTLVEKVRHQWLVTHLLIFEGERPLLTDVGKIVSEVRVKVELQPGQPRIVRKSFAAEIAEDEPLGPELWAKGWIEYLKAHRDLEPAEFSALLDHLAQGGRPKWPNKVAMAGAKAQRAVAAVACELLESLAGPPDQSELQRLYSTIDNFSEKYEMEAIVKRRFPA